MWCGSFVPTLTQVVPSLTSKSFLGDLDTGRVWSVRVTRSHPSSPLRYHWGPCPGGPSSYTLLFRRVHSQLGPQSEMEGYFTRGGR